MKFYYDFIKGFLFCSSNPREAIIGCIDALFAWWPRRNNSKWRIIRVRRYKTLLIVVFLGVLAFPPSLRALDLGLIPRVVNKDP